MNDVHTFAAEYAVGSLTADESQEFETHLATCFECREEVAEMRDIAARLSDAVATDPPPHLRAAVLAQIADTAQDAPSLHAAGTFPDTAAPAREAGEPPSGRHLAQQRSTVPSAQRTSPDTGQVSGTAGPVAAGSNVVPLQRRSAARWMTGLLAAASVLAAVAMGGWAISSRNDARDAAAQSEQLTQLLSARDVRTVSGGFGSGGGTVVISASRGQALLVASGLPALPSGKVYEAWALTGGMVPAGTFTADGAQTVLRLSDAAVHAKQVAVTVEPAGGSRQPTTDPVFSVDVPNA